jgi:acyl-coenzyme A thioesterase PaaI-like protein
MTQLRCRAIALQRIIGFMERTRPKDNSAVQQTADTRSHRPDLTIATEGEFAGWRTWTRDTFESHNGPFWHRIDDDGRVRCAFRVEKKHLNGMKAVHGGCFMTFADYCLFAIATRELDGPGVTVAFGAEFLDAAFEGELIEAFGEVTRAGKSLMETYGARCIASPSTETDSGRAILAANPNSPGSLGIAISEAVEVAAKNPDIKYALGSVLNHVMLHQTIIGQEAIKQCEMAGDDPDVIIGCAGGGSNFAGLAFPFLGLQLRGGRRRRIIAVEPAACPTLTRGTYAYDFGDTAHLTPLVKMHTLGSTFIPPGFHAGGLRYHGMSGMVSHAYELGLIEARAYKQVGCFEAGVQFARTEGIVPAPESTHAVRCAIDEALRCKAEGKAETILFNLSGHGHFDMQAYINYFEGKLVDQDYNEADLETALAALPAVAA